MKRIALLFVFLMSLALLCVSAFAADSGRWAVFPINSDKYYCASADSVTKWTYAWPDENGNRIIDQDHLVPIFRKGDPKFEKAMDAKTFVANGRSYVPVRYLALALGVPESGIIWDGKTRTVTLTMGDVTLKMVIGKKTLYVNSTAKQMDVAPVIKGGRTYLPARFVAEAFGYQVGFYDSAWADVPKQVLVGPKDRLPRPIGPDGTGYPTRYANPGGVIVVK